jgi:hypothetical protein
MASFGLCVLHQMDEEVTRESISVVTEIAPISLSNPWKLQGCWLYLGLHHLYGMEDSDQEKELAEYVVRGKVRRVRIHASHTYLDVFWPALAQEFAVEHNWLAAAVPTTFTPPGKVELTNQTAQAVLQTAPKKICTPSPTESPTTVATTSFSPKRFARPMSKSEAHSIAGSKAVRKANQNRQRQSTPLKTKPPPLPSSSSVSSAQLQPTAAQSPPKRKIRPSANYQLVDVPRQPKELESKEIYVELSQWYCEQQLGDDLETASRLLVRGKVVQVEQRKEAWVVDVFWPVFNETSSIELSMLTKIGARWGTPPGTKELSHEEWYDGELQPQPCIVTPPTSSVSPKRKMRRPTRLADIQDPLQGFVPGNFTISSDDCLDVLGKVLYAPFEAVNATLRSPREPVPASAPPAPPPAASSSTSSFPSSSSSPQNVYVKGRIQRVQAHLSIPVCLITWEAIDESAEVPLSWFRSAGAMDHLPEGAEVLSAESLPKTRKASSDTVVRPERPVIYRACLAWALLSSRKQRRRVPRQGSCCVFARECCRCGKSFAVYNEVLLTARRDDNPFCCQGCAAARGTSTTST